ncbi:MAG: hypothetical protein IPM42_03365 [Saprospiraceae bacterium]|nr:hypothetical protein [Saprospiraceae bacterium]
MNQYTFVSGHRNILIGAMIIGVLCMGLTWMNDDALHTRFWTNFLHNSVFFAGIALMAGFFIAACITAYAGWYTVFKRVWEAYASFLLVGIILMAIIGLGVYMHWHHLYHWSDEKLLDPANPEYDKILAGKSSFLNKNWYMFGTVVFGAIWIFIIHKLRTLSLEEDSSGTSGFFQHKSMRVYAAIFLPIVGFTSAAMIWQWIMSVDSHWYSTLFAWYSTASWFVSMIALTILLLIFLKSLGYYKDVSANHIHDLGKYMFAFSVFWTYLWFSQFMLIWYANIGEETIYFRLRYDNYPVLFFGNLAINFLVPFFVLMRNDTKRKFGSVAIVAIILLLGHWIDFFLMIKPGALHTAHEVLGHAADAGAHGDHGVAHASSYVPGFTLPGLLELGTFVGFLGLFLFVSLNTLSKAALVPKNDPYLEESLHHHV